MTQLKAHSRTKSIVVSLILNFLLSWMVLPFVVPPFHAYSIRELMEVLLWQGIATIGWPLALFGGIASTILQGRFSDLLNFLIILIYPAMLFLFILILFSKRSARWMLILLHVLIVFSFAALWYQVRNGYNFMSS